MWNSQQSNSYIYTGEIVFLQSDQQAPLDSYLLCFYIYGFLCPLACTVQQAKPRTAYEEIPLWHILETETSEDAVSVTMSCAGSIMNTLPSHVDTTIDEHR